MKSPVPRAGSVVVAVITLSIGASLAACGGSGGGDDVALSPAEQPLADAIASDLMSLTDDLLDDTQGQCFGDRVVNSLGADRLSEVGVTVESPGGLGGAQQIDLTEDEANTVVDVMDDCIGVKAYMNAVFTTLIGAEDASCISDQINDDETRDLLVSAMLTNDLSAEQDKLMSEASIECGVATS